MPAGGIFRTTYGQKIKNAPPAQEGHGKEESGLSKRCLPAGKV